MDLDSEFVQLVRLSLEGKRSDVTAIARRTLRRILERRPDLAGPVRQALGLTTPTREALGAAAPLPVDTETRLELVRREYPVNIDVPAVWHSNVSAVLDAIVKERQLLVELSTAGVEPTRSALLIGPPGVGKTLAARTLASRLGLPLLTLDLAAVMSSFLGKTGNNVRAVLEYGRQQPSVLLLDEFDAIAKRRDDAADVGELKRLVNVLLQAVDDWPAEGLLVAATNHPELLDPAVWRRFDLVVEFPRPTAGEVLALISAETPNLDSSSPDAHEILQFIAAALAGSSFSAVSRELAQVRRAAVIEGTPLLNQLRARAAALGRALPMERRLAVARALEGYRWSQRQISEATGLSRDTIRKHLKTSPAPQKRAVRPTRRIGGNHA